MIKNLKISLIPFDARSFKFDISYLTFKKNSQSSKVKKNYQRRESIKFQRALLRQVSARRWIVVDPRSMTSSDEICLDHWSLNLSAGCQVEVALARATYTVFNIGYRFSFTIGCYIKISGLARVVSAEFSGKVRIYACRVLQRPVITRLRLRERNPR